MSKSLHMNTLHLINAHSPIQTSVQLGPNVFLTGPMSRMSLGEMHNPHHREFSGGITTLTVLKPLCSDGHLDRSRSMHM